jgi:hypothetical protein
MMSNDQSVPRQSPVKPASQIERRAAALRANLRRRKAQQRGRAGESQAGEGDTVLTTEKPEPPANS